MWTKHLESVNTFRKSIWFTDKWTTGWI